MPALHIAALARIRRLEAQHVVFASYMKQLQRRSFAARSVETYADCLIGCHRWLAEQDRPSPLQVTPADLDQFLIHLAGEDQPGGRGVSVGRRGVYVAVLRSFYRFAAQERYLLRDPAAKQQVPVIRHQTVREQFHPPAPASAFAASPVQRLCNPPAPQTTSSAPHPG